MLKRSPLPPRKTPLKRSAFKRHGRKSARKVAQLNAWIAEKERAYAESGGRCQARFSANCNGHAEHPHHLRKRSLGGNVNPMCKWVCDPCHSEIETRPADAMKVGLYVSHKAA